MTLTEEQQEAIKYAISSLEQCGSEPEDPVVAKILRAMIDSSEDADYESLRCENCGKTLKEIRGSKYAGDYRLGEIRIDPGQEASISDPPIEPSYYFWCDECKNDSSDQFSDLTKLIPGFDLERVKADLGDIGDPRFCDCEVRTQLAAAIDEIERLRASLTDLHAEYINTLEKNPGCSAWDLDEQSDADQRRLRRNAAHAISIVEPPIYLKAEQQLAKIKELETAYLKAQNSNLLRKQEIERLRPFEIAARDLDSDLGKIAGERDEQSARIKELEAERAVWIRHYNDTRKKHVALKKLGKMVRQRGKWLMEERANKMIQSDDCTQNQDAADFHHRCICEYNVKKCPVEKWWLDRARQALQAEDKICNGGPYRRNRHNGSVLADHGGAKGCNRDLLANATQRGKLLHEPPKQRRRARDAPGHVEGVRAMQMEMRTPVIKFRVEQDESGKIGYRVTKIEGFEENEETDEEENEMQFTSTPRIYVRNENNHIILKIKSLMFTILTLEEGKIAENIRNQDDIDYWKHVMEAKTIYWNDTVVAYNERTPIVGSQTEMRINHRD